MDWTVADKIAYQLNDANNTMEALTSEINAAIKEIADLLEETTKTSTCPLCGHALKAKVE